MAICTQAGCPMSTATSSPVVTVVVYITFCNFNMNSLWCNCAT